MKKLSRGMSLVEVVIAMAIIGIISLLVYRGISTGVNIISMGAITHSVKAFDISMRIKK